MNRKIAIGVLCYGDKESNPARFEVLTKCIKALEKIKRDDVYLFCFDNNSCSETQKFLNSQSHFDHIFRMKNNFYDFGAMIALNLIAEKINSKYVLFLNDDCYLYKENSILDGMEFLDHHYECGAIKLIKFEVNSSAAYNKAKGSKSPNAQRMYNTISSEALKARGPFSINDSDFYKSNWHWHSMPVLCRREVYNEILPKKDMEPLQSVEGYMMKKYNNLGMEIGFLDGGAFDHMIHPNKSVRVELMKKGKLQSSNAVIIKYNKVCSSLRKSSSFRNL